MVSYQFVKILQQCQLKFHRQKKSIDRNKHQMKEVPAYHIDVAFVVCVYFEAYCGHFFILFLFLIFFIGSSLGFL